MNSDGLDLANHAILAAYMLQELADNRSYWQPYLRTLPKDLTHIPVFYTDKELKALQGSHILETILRRKALLAKEYRLLKKQVPDFEKFSQHDYFWARTAINSRCFSVDHVEGAKVAMIPMADMLNHSREKNVTWGGSHDGDGFLVRAHSPLRCGHQVLMSYGSKDNGRFFSGYGFLPKDQNYYLARVTVILDWNDPNYEHKKRLLYGETQKNFKLSTTLDEHFQDLFHYLLVCTSERLDEAVRSYSLADEVRVLRKLRHVCEQALDQYPSLLSDDLKLLQCNAANLKENELNMVQIVVSEKNDTP